MATTFPAAIEEITAGDRWIFDSGGPPPVDPVRVRLRELLWSRADTVLWLDYSQPVVLWRAATRSLRRMVTRERLWHGYRDTPAQWLRADHPVRRAWSAHRRRRQEIAARIAEPARHALTVHRLHRPDETEAFMRRLRLEPRG